MAKSAATSGDSGSRGRPSTRSRVTVAKSMLGTALVARSPYLLVAHPSFPARGVRELIAVAKGSPGQVNFASSGSASLPHLAGELFQLMAGVKMNHIPYKGGTPATIDTLAGQVPIIFNNMLNAVPHVKSGKMRALGVTGAQRTAILQTARDKAQEKVQQARQQIQAETAEAKVSLERQSEEMATWIANAVLNPTGGKGGQA